MNNNLLWKILGAFIFVEIVFLALRFAPFIIWILIVALVIFSITRKSKPSMNPKNESEHRAFRSHNGKDVIDVEYSEREVK